MGLLCCNLYAKTLTYICDRQLEAIVRISESLAKMTLSPHATEEHVDEAIRLFNHSTMSAIQSGAGVFHNFILLASTHGHV